MRERSDWMGKWRNDWRRGGRMIRQMEGGGEERNERDGEFRAACAGT